MSEFRIDQIKSQDASRGPDVAGITTFTGTSGIVMPSGNTFRRYSQDNIVDDGLIFYLDASNALSYPGSGTVWYDLTVGTNSGTLTNGPTYSSSDGGSIVFDGTNDHIVYTNPGTPDNYTYEAWIRPTRFQASSSEDHGIFGTTGTTRSQFDLNEGSEPGSNSKLRLYDSGLTPTELEYEIDNVDLVNKWSYVAVTRNGTTTTLYLNGEIVKQGTQTGSGNSHLTNVIGASYTGSNQYFEGNIAQVRIYGRPLKALEIKQNFNVFKGRYGV